MIVTTRPARSTIRVKSTPVRQKQASHPGSRFAPARSGTCACCGSKISAKILEADSNTILCPTCQTALELNDNHAAET